MSSVSRRHGAMAEVVMYTPKEREGDDRGVGGAVEQLSCSRQREARCCESKAAAKPGPPLACFGRLSA